MSKELYVASTPHETKLAIVEEDLLSEIYFERENEYTLAGSIYKGRVTRVLPGMQSAFVDIGLERDAFLYVTDFMEEQDPDEELETIPVPTERHERSRDQDGGRNAWPEAAPAGDGPAARALDDEETGEGESEAGTADENQYESENESADENADENQDGPQAAGPAGAQPDGEGVRRWRGRRRRGRRRGRPEEPRGEPANTLQAEPEKSGPEPSAETSSGRGQPARERPSEATRVPTSYAPMILPGESIAKFATGESAKFATGESAKFATGESAKFATGESAKFATGDSDIQARAEHPREDGPREERGRSQERGSDRGYARGRERRYGRGNDRGGERGNDRGSERRPSRGYTRGEDRRDDTRGEGTRGEAEAASLGNERPRERSRDFGPPPGYSPIMLPGESIAKYQQQPAQGEPRSEAAASQAGVSASRSDDPENRLGAEEERTKERTFAETGVAANPAYENRPARDEGRRGAAAALTSSIEEDTSIEEDSPREEGTTIEEYGRSEATGARGAVSSDSPYHHRMSAAGATEFIGEPHAEHGAPGGTAMGSQAGGGEQKEEEARVETYPAAAHDAPQRFSPGEGHLEEEVIDEEEVETSSLEEGLEEDDLEDLEEQIMERHAERVADVVAGLQAANLSSDAPTAEFVERVEPGEGGYDGLESAAETQELSEADYDGPEVSAAEEGEDEELEESESAEAGEGEQAERGEDRATSAAGSGLPQRSRRPGFDRQRGRFRRGPGRRFMRRNDQPRSRPLISELLKEGQEILVQIAKEPIGRKGARITSHIALPGRFLVYMPTVDHIGVSRKISSDEERQRLKRIVLSERENGHGGFIVRTAADRADERELRADIGFLKNLWHEIKERAQKAKPPALIYHDLNLVERVLRDQVNQNFSTIWVDTEQEYERVVRFVSRFQSSMVKRVKLYSKETPLFEQFNIQEEINKALKSKVWLKSGGYIVINQTEALVAIDVNTGKYVGKTARLEDTIVKTNVDAIKEIVRQIRLRDLGGIIVIDFIDMDERRNRQKVMVALEEALKADRAPSKVLQFNDFGLVAITRKRVKQSLERTLGAGCPYCTGTGLVKSVTTVCNEIWVEMRKLMKHLERPDVLLRVNPEVAKALKANSGKWIQELEELTGKNLIVKSDPTLHQEQFDIT